MKDEPFFTALDLKIEAYTGRLLRRLRENVSIMVVADESNEIMGVFTSAVMRKSHKIDINSVTDESMRAMFTFASQKEPAFDIFARCGADVIFHLANLSVHNDYRRQGLGFILLESAVDFAKALGFKGITGEGTSNYSQKLFEKLGFETILRLPYSEYKYKQRYLSERTGEHTCMKKYFMSF